jgi:hypothetical protein
MRSIERRFNTFQHKRPILSSLINFGAAIREQRFSDGAIHRWFNKLVEKDDYARNDKRTILSHLVALSGAEGDKN